MITVGLANNVPRHVAVVATLSLTEYIAMLEMLTKLEGLACSPVGPADAHGPKTNAARSVARLRGCCRTQRFRGLHQANGTFHETIDAGSLNDVPARQLSLMRLRMRRPQRTLFDRPNRKGNSLIEHQTLLAAILAGDEGGDDRAIKTHISSGGNVYVDAVAHGRVGK